MLVRKEQLEDLPEHVDWRDKGVITPVMDQVQEDQARRSAEAHAREAVLRADEAEAALARARSTGLEHLEGRVREVQGELEAEQQRCASLGRDVRQAERGRREAEAEVEVVGRRAGLLQVTSPTPSLARTRCAACRAG